MFVEYGDEEYSLLKEVKRFFFISRDVRFKLMMVIFCELEDIKKIVDMGCNNSYLYHESFPKNIHNIFGQSYFLSLVEGPGTR